MSNPTGPDTSTALRRQRVFQLLWAADTASQHGTATATAVMPLIAATLLEVTPLEMSVLAAAEMLAFLLIGLPAGAWMDRTRRRPVLIRADLARAVLLSTIPLAAWLGALTLPHLIAVALLAGVAAVFFDVAYQAYLPSAIGESNLTAGYANLHATQSAAAGFGPALGGVLVALLGVSAALVATAVSHLASAGLIGRIRVPEPDPAPEARAPLRVDIVEGVRFVVTHRQLRALTVSSAVAAFFAGAVIALEVLVFTRDLHLGSIGAGVLLALSGIGSIMGAAAAPWCARTLGQNRALWLVPMLTWPVHVLFPLATMGGEVALAAVGILVFAVGAGVYNVLAMTMRQKLAPERLRGRVNSSMRFVIWGCMPLGALAAGGLATAYGTRAALWIAVGGTVAALLTLLAPSLRERPGSDPAPPR